MKVIFKAGVLSHIESAFFSGIRCVPHVSPFYVDRWLALRERKLDSRTRTHLPLLDMRDNGIYEEEETK